MPKGTGKIKTSEIRGETFKPTPRKEPGRTKCPDCNTGYVVWNGGSQDYHFTCTRCDWTSGGVGGKLKVRRPVKKVAKGRRK